MPEWLVFVVEGHPSLEPFFKPARNGTFGHILLSTSEGEAEEIGNARVS